MSYAPRPRRLGGKGSVVFDPAALKDDPEMTTKKLGATGKFPQGKLNQDDEGELRLAVSSAGDLVRIDFGKAITWLAMPPDEAIEFGKILIKVGMETRRQ